MDLGQRSKEFAAYYKREVKPKGPRPVCLYWIWDEEKVARGIDCLGSDEKRHSALIERPERSGIIFAGPSDFTHSSYWDTAALREFKPVKRFGNLFIFRGTFYLPEEPISREVCAHNSKHSSTRPKTARFALHFRIRFGRYPARSYLRSIHCEILTWNDVSGRPRN